ncbi:MAG: rhodanese-like domain-containing protein [Cloacibacterium sp.]|nr:rhodanese-like domain-containing protein [Cloacibacterium sp.]
MTIQEVLQSGKYHLIDVREPMELMMDGAIDGATNIPLGEVPDRIQEIKDMDGAKIVYCRSGNRSGQAIAFLQQNGLEDLYNGGGYADMVAVLG